MIIQNKSTLPGENINLNLEFRPQNAWNIERSSNSRPSFFSSLLFSKNWDFSELWCYDFCWNRRAGPQNIIQKDISINLYFWKFRNIKSKGYNLLSQKQRIDTKHIWRACTIFRSFSSIFSFNTIWINIFIVKSF